MTAMLHCSKTVRVDWACDACVHALGEPIWAVPEGDYVHVKQTKDH